MCFRNLSLNDLKNVHKCCDEHRRSLPFDHRSLVLVAGRGGKPHAWPNGTIKLELDRRNASTTGLTAPAQTAGQRSTHHPATDNSRTLSAGGCPCGCHRLQAMEESRRMYPERFVYYGPWRGRLPRYSHCYLIISWPAVDYKNSLQPMGANLQ